MKIIRLKKGDKIVDSITKELKKDNIKSGYAYGLGAVSKAELMIYKLSNKEYVSKSFEGDYEVASLQATITLDENGEKIMIHPHIVITDDKFNAYGGHLKEATVAATLEVAIIKSDQDISRYKDEDIGLNLISI